MIKKVLSNKKIITKWFYNYADTEEFKRKFLVTVRSLVALKKMNHTKIGLVGGISPGFDNMKVDQSIIKQNIGLSVEESTIKELVKIAKSFDQKTIDNEVLKIKSVASDISVSNDDSFNRVARIYFALKKMKEDNNWDSLAVQCWSQMQELYGVAPYLARHGATPYNSCI